MGNNGNNFFYSLLFKAIMLTCIIIFSRYNDVGVYIKSALWFSV